MSDFSLSVNDLPSDPDQGAEKAGAPAPQSGGGLHLRTGRDPRDPQWLRQPLDQSGRELPFVGRRSRRWVYSVKFTSAERQDLIARARMEKTTVEQVVVRMVQSRLLAAAGVLGSGL